MVQAGEKRRKGLDPFAGMCYDSTVFYQRGSVPQWGRGRGREAIGMLPKAGWPWGLLFILCAMLLVASGCVRAKPPRALVPPVTPVQLASAGQSETVIDALTPQAGNEAYPAPSPTITPLPSPTAQPYPLPEPTLTQTLFPQPSPTAAPTLAAETTYVVKPGDTLASIAAAHGTSVAAIMARNNLTNPDSLVVGQILIIPIGQAPEVPIPAVVVHIVRAGETLYQIARRYGTTPAAIQATNPSVTDPNRLQIGMRLTITPGTVPPQRTHIVRPGETVNSIARRYGVGVSSLVQVNGLSNPNRLVVGQVLIIP
jgi:LysM repeat protein